MVGDRGRHQPAEQITGDIARDVRGEGAGCVRRAAFLAEIGEHQGEGRRHEDALSDAQGGEDHEVGCDGEKRRRD